MSSTSITLGGVSVSGYPVWAVLGDGDRSGSLSGIEGEPSVAGLVRADTGKKRILVAEDIECNFRLIYAILRKEYELTWVVNGAEAVKRARTERFDTILMDMKMPVMDGLEATEHIRAFDRSIPILAVTAYVYDSDRIAAMKAGCNDFLNKPVSRALLLDALNKWA